MLSRVADNLYWFGRYLQRAENTARLINVNTTLLLDLPNRTILGWAPLVQIVGADAIFRSLYSEASEENVVRFLVLDLRNPGSIQSSLHQAREILRTIRDATPSEAWERLNDVYFFVRERGETAVALRSKRLSFLAGAISGTLLVESVLNSNMSRDVGYRFLQIGNAIEQADMTTRILDVRTTLLSGSTGLKPFENSVWMSVLRSLAAYQMYRRNAKTRVNGAGVLRFLLQNREFPRSVSYCLSEIAAALHHLPSNRSIERSIERSRSLVRDANLDVLMKSSTGVPDLMDEIQIGLGDIHQGLAEAFCGAAAGTGN